ncbi:MAG: hypothetical protein HYT70_04375 [Candidatus Aenigmarchaeota archaeon]|nr:hypothetical protein [Candidatus Aenigmarchaeota archaeon]
MANRGHYSRLKTQFMGRVNKELERLDSLKGRVLSDAGHIEMFEDADAFIQELRGVVSDTLSAYDRTVRPRKTNVYIPSGSLSRAYIINKAEELMISQGYVKPSDIAVSWEVAHILGSEYTQHGWRRERPKRGEEPTYYPS